MLDTQSLTESFLVLLYFNAMFPTLNREEPKVLDRKISMLELEQLILNPDQIIEQGPKFIFVKKFTKRKDNNIAAVILEKKGKDLWVVITVMINFQIK